MFLLHALSGFLMLNYVATSADARACSRKQLKVKAQNPESAKLFCVMILRQLPKTNATFDVSVAHVALQNMSRRRSGVSTLRNRLFMYSIPASISCPAVQSANNGLSSILRNCIFSLNKSTLFRNSIIDVFVNQDADPWIYEIYRKFGASKFARSVHVTNAIGGDSDPR